MPDLATSAIKTNYKKFVNHDIGTQLDTFIYEESSETESNLIWKNKYVTKYIDTTYRHNDETYFVCYRAFCFGRNGVKLVVRARNCKNSNPNVHSKDTPLSSSLLNRLYDYFLKIHWDEMKLITRNLYEKLGLGFYACDILPSFETKSIFICEVGFKMTDKSIIDRLKPIQNELPYMQFFENHQISDLIDLTILEAEDIFKKKF